jgi:arylsulfatase A-like enzyme
MFATPVFRSVIWFGAWVFAAVTSFAADRPNILWITFEDSSTHLGAYGDKLAVTPNFDRFAKGAIRFDRAIAYTGVCAPARSTLISGVYPNRLGSHHMRSAARLPAGMKLLSEYLRDAGYYASNNVKEDYNFVTPKTAWDESSNTAHWRKRKPGQPFFAVFNHMISHQSQVFGPDETAKQKGQPPPPTQHEQTAAVVAPIHPDTPEFRREWARHFDNLTTMDGQAQKILDELKADGLEEDTIVFWFADNGTGMPAIKGWAWHMSVNVPCLVHFPKKWEHLRAGLQDGATSRVVSFIDFAPTVLSLAGVKVPEHMQGTAFFGAAAGPARRYAFGGKERHSDRYDMIRYVHDGRLQYLRNFLPHLPWGQMMSYNYQHASLRKWQELHDQGKLTGVPARFFQAKPMEELYDTTVDPWCTKNLAGDPGFAADLKRLRTELENWMVQNGDLGLLPENEMHRRSAGSTPYELATNRAQNPVKELLGAARLANERDPKNISQLVKLMDHRDPAFRWWGATGLVALGTKANPGEAALRKALADESPDVRVAAAEALGNIGRVDVALSALEKELTNPSVFIRLTTTNAIDRLGPKAKPLIPVLSKAKIPDQEQFFTQEYVERMIEYMPARLGGN